MFEVCELWGYGVNVLGKQIRCTNDLHNHHILNKSKYQKSNKVKVYIKKNHEVFLARVCSTHNVDRWADTPAARRILLKRKSELLGSDYVRSVWAEIPWKVIPHELTYDAIMVAPLPK